MKSKKFMLETNPPQKTPKNLKIQLKVLLKSHDVFSILTLMEVLHLG